ncbi:hypothetical protein, partial [Pseudomonas aeruginosa]|uniref:hypothetical protein n=1 Tax=Pseudomonas aeruginosa TaxID=287 RepID=UPI001A8C642D
MVPIPAPPPDVAQDLVPACMVQAARVRIPRHPATQSALIWPGIPGPSGHLFHGHPAGQSERSDAGVA